MQLSPLNIKNILKKKSLTLSDALKKAQISKTAFYSLTRKDSLLPKSVHKLAKTLGVPPKALLHDDTVQELKAKKRQEKLACLLKKFPQLDPDNVWHTLILLEQTPLQRLKRSLTRGQGKHLHP